jgi:NADH-quinone oxidoreductase subunit D
MIEQCISMIKPGKHILDNYKITPPFKGDAKMNMEDMIHHFKFFSDGFNVPAGEIYVATEAPKGEFGVHIVADGSNKPYRCYIRAPGFAHLQATNMMLKGHMFSDTVSIISTQDIVFGEVDR